MVWVNRFLGCLAIWCAAATVNAGEQSGGMKSPPGFRDASADTLKGTPLASLAPYIGDWEIDAEWSSGLALWARNEYRVLLGGAFVDVLTWAKDGDGEPYVRYYSVYSWDAEQGKIIATGFQSDGTSQTLVMEPASDEPADGLRTHWGEYPARIRQDVGAPKDGRYTWNVWMQTSADAEPAEMISGVWIKQEDSPMSSAQTSPPAGPYPIDPGLFIAGGNSDARWTSHKEIIKAPASRLFGMLSSEAGLKEVYSIESRIDLAVGGPFEWFFDDESPYGSKGGEGNQILAWIPGRMLAFSWNAPPSQPKSRAMRTWVVVEFDEIHPGVTEVQITHLGFGIDEHWNETFEYFRAAWQKVLAALKAAAEK